MCKVITITSLLMLLLLVSFSTTLARPQPQPPQPHDHLNHQIINKDEVVEIAEELETELETWSSSSSSCEGKAEGLEKQECLMMMSRRILINNAHEDYIYTCGDCPPQNLRP